MADLAAPLFQVLALCELLLASLERVADDVDSLDLREELRKTIEETRAELERLKAAVPRADDPAQ
jgi:hypothetical protein